MLYNLERRPSTSTASTAAAHKDAWQNDPIWQADARERRAADRHPRLGRGVLRDDRRLRAARRRAVPQRVRHAAPPRCRATSSRRRSWARRVRRAPRHRAARARCSGMLADDARARRRQPRRHAGLAGRLDAGQPRRGAPAAADLVAGRREAPCASTTRSTPRAAHRRPAGADLTLEGALPRRPRA